MRRAPRGWPISGQPRGRRATRPPVPHEGGQQGATAMIGALGKAQWAFSKAPTTDFKIRIGKILHKLYYGTAAGYAGGLFHNILYVTLLQGNFLRESSLLLVRCY